MNVLNLMRMLCKSVLDLRQMVQQDIETAGTRFIIPVDSEAAGDVASQGLDQMLQQSSHEVRLSTSVSLVVLPGPALCHVLHQ